jgi:hypothetical protein
MELPFGLDPYANDPGEWGASLLFNAELVLGCLDAAQARSVTEIGAYAGDLTLLLLRWGEIASARVVAVDPVPQPELEALEREHPELQLVRETSLVALARIEPADAIVLDGDHNYYTVSEELRLIASNAEQASRSMPLLLIHDVCWPHGRRDLYFDPEQIPHEHRQPIARDGLLYPRIPGIHDGGLRYRWPAAQEGGPRNGVLTAIEDFIAQRQDLRLAVIPAFFGLGVLWPTSSSYHETLRALLEPWDRNPLLARMERNRVLHLASSWVQLQRAERAEAALGRLPQQEALLEQMLASRIFSAAELVLRIRQRGKPVFSKREIRAVLARD